MPHLILTVCRGNIHRSVVAELCIRKSLQELGWDDKFYVASRGLQGSAGTDKPDYQNLMQYPDDWTKAEPSLRRLGIEIPNIQIATPVDRDIIAKASLILAMEQKVLSESNYSLIKQFPEFTSKMRLFSENDIPDCYGSKSTEMYWQVNMAIHETVKTEIQNICQLAEMLDSQT